MAHQATTHHLPEGGAAALHATGIDSMLDRLWHFLTSMRFAMLLMLAMAALALVGTLIMQMPGGVATSEQARADWLAGVRPRYGGWTNILDTLGMFTVFTSIWFRGVVTLLTISLLACSVHRIPGIWKTAVHPHVDVGETFFEHAPQHERIVVTHSAQELTASTIAILKKHHYRVVTQDDGALHLFADRNRWSPIGSLAGHLSLVVILAGGIVGAAFGFGDDQFMITEGTTAPVPGMAGTALRLDAFRDTYYIETGAPSDYASDVSVLKDGQQVAAQTVRVNQPLRYGDLSFYQSFFGTAAMMTVVDTDGTPIVSQGVPLAWDSPDGLHRVGTFSLPAQGLVGWVIGTSGPDDTLVKPGQMRIELYQATGDGSLVDAQTVDQGVPTDIAGVKVTFDRETQFTGLSVSKDPGAPLVWLGGLMLFLGVVAVFMFPTRRLWGRLITRPDGGAALSLGAVGRKGDSGFLQEFQGLADEIRQAAIAPHNA